MAEENVEARAKRVVIDPEGDVLLRVGDPQVLLLVSSKVLSVASDVFRAMFSPKFQEGQELAERTGRPHEVELPDDEPASMELLCRILHFQRDALPALPPMPTLKALATACDKWNCNAAAGWASRDWVEALLRAPAGAGASEDGTAKLDLLAVAYLFDDPRAFERISWHLILNRSEGFAEAAVEREDDLLPLEVYVALDKRRTHLRLLLEDGIQSPVRGFLAKERFAPTTFHEDSRAHGAINHPNGLFGVHDAFAVAAYFRELHRLQLWPLSVYRASLADVLERINAFEHREIGHRLGFRMFARHAWCNACDLDPRLAINQLLERMAAESVGLCLDCVKKGPGAGAGSDNDGATATCRLQSSVQHARHTALKPNASLSWPVPLEVQNQSFRNITGS